MRARRLDLPKHFLREPTVQENRVAGAVPYMRRRLRGQTAPILLALAEQLYPFGAHVFADVQLVRSSRAQRLLFLDFDGAQLLGDQTIKLVHRR